MEFKEKVMKIQLELKAPKGQFNSFGKYSYRSCEDILEALKPLMAKFNVYINISDEIVAVGDRVYVKATAAIHDMESAGAVFATAFAREPDEKKGMDASQVTGSASSYARKYALNGLLCIDDTKDADTMDNRQTEKPAEKPKLICECCGKEIKAVKVNGQEFTAWAVGKRSKDRYGKSLCWACSKEEAARQKAAEGETPPWES